MLIQKLKKIRNMLLKNNQTDAPAPKLMDEFVKTQDSDNTKPLLGIKYLQRKEMASHKKYFDSADHFLKLYELENENKALAQTAIIDVDIPNSSQAIEKNQAPPLEAAYSEIIDEMKPKESV